MSIFNQIKQTKDRVRVLLEKHPHLREDDYKLICTFWKQEVGERIFAMSANDFLKDLSEGKYTHPETIRRNRASIQKALPNLRGTNYQNRQEQGVKVAAEINHA